MAYTVQGARERATQVVRGIESGEEVAGLSRELEQASQWAACHRAVATLAAIWLLQKRLEEV